MKSLVSIVVSLLGAVVASLTAVFTGKAWGKEKAKRKMYQQQERAMRDAKKLDDDLARRPRRSKRDEMRDKWSRPG